MISFAVKLIRVPPISDLSGWDVFGLMVNARHVSGDYWFFEGDVEALDVSGAVEVVADGVTEGIGDMNDRELKSHCEEIFGVELDGTDPSWKMLADHHAEAV